MIRRLFAFVVLATLLASPAAAQILRKPDNSAAYQAMDQATGQGIKDGVGAPADAAYTGSGSASQIAVEKGSFNKLEAIRALLNAQPAGTSAAPVVQVPGALPASGVTSATTTLTSSTVWSPTFSYVAGRTFYLTLGGAGSGTVTVVYSRDNWSTSAPEVTAVDGSAPIVLNKIAYAGSQVVIPLSVSEAGVKVGVLPGTLTGAVTATLTQ